MRRVFLMRSMASVIDQTMLSGLNFLIGLVLIRLAAKETYGLYSQLFALVMLASTLLEALIGTALTTHAARVPDETRPGLLARVFRLQWLAAAGFALLFASGIWVSSRWIAYSEPLLPLVGAVALLIFSQACREYCRTALFIESRAKRVMGLDAVFVGLSIVLGGVFVDSGRMSVAGVLALLGVANLVVALVFGRAILAPLRPGPQHGAHAQGLVHDARALWSMSRWALAGAVLAWCANYSYLYFSSMFVGAATLADLNASRLLLMPTTVLIMAWARVARPQMGRLISEGNLLRLQRLMGGSSAMTVAFALVYAAALWAFFPWLQRAVLGDKYAHVAPLLLVWGLYFALNSARIIGTTALVAYGAFRALFWQGFSSVVLLVGLCLALIPRWGVHGSLAAMMAVELVELLTNWFYMLPKARRGGFRTH